MWLLTPPNHPIHLGSIQLLVMWGVRPLVWSNPVALNGVHLDPKGGIWRPRGGIWSREAIWSRGGIGEKSTLTSLMNWWTCRMMPMWIRYMLSKVNWCGWIHKQGHRGREGGQGGPWPLLFSKTSDFRKYRSFFENWYINMICKRHIQISTPSPKYL